MPPRPLRLWGPLDCAAARVRSLALFCIFVVCRLYIYIYIYTQTHIYIYIYTHVYVHIYIYIYIYTHVYAYTYILILYYTYLYVAESALAWAGEVESCHRMAAKDWHGAWHGPRELPAQLLCPKYLCTPPDVQRASSFSTSLPSVRGKLWRAFFPRPEWELRRLGLRSADLTQNTKPGIMYVDGPRAFPKIDLELGPHYTPTKLG